MMRVSCCCVFRPRVFSCFVLVVRTSDFFMFQWPMLIVCSTPLVWWSAPSLPSCRLLSAFNYVVCRGVFSRFVSFFKMIINSLEGENALVIFYACTSKLQTWTATRDTSDGVSSRQCAVLWFPRARWQAAGVYHQVKSEIDIHVNYGSGCPNIVRCYGYFYDEKRWGIRNGIGWCVCWRRNRARGKSAMDLRSNPFCATF